MHFLQPWIINFINERREENIDSRQMIDFRWRENFSEKADEKDFQKRFRIPLDREENDKTARYLETGVILHDKRKLGFMDFSSRKEKKISLVFNVYLIMLFLVCLKNK